MNERTPLVWCGRRRNRQTRDPRGSEPVDGEKGRRGWLGGVHPDLWYSLMTILAVPCK